LGGKGKEQLCEKGREYDYQNQGQTHVLHRDSPVTPRCKKKKIPRTKKKVKDVVSQRETEKVQEKKEKIGRDPRHSEKIDLQGQCSKERRKKRSRMVENKKGVGRNRGRRRVK